MLNIDDLDLSAAAIAARITAFCVSRRFVAATLLLCMAASSQAATALNFRIDLSHEIETGRFDPRKHRVGVRGSQWPLSWNTSLTAQDPTGSGLYTVHVLFDRLPFGGQPLQYKFKLERGAGPDDGWEDGANRQLLLAEGAQQVERAFNSTVPALPLQRTGVIQRLPAVESRHVAAREVQVWLPPGYAASPRRYPVLYLHDGQNVFDAAAAGAEWQVDETAQRLVRSKALPPMMIVAVSIASSASRSHDYTPVPGRYRGQQQGGGAAAYARFLTEELKPLIDTRFRTLPGRRDTWLGGSSLGGLVTMWMLLHHGDQFGAGLVVSPSVWWADEAILNDVAAVDPHMPKPRIWLDIGLREGDDAVAGVRRLHKMLRERGWRDGQLLYTEKPDAAHDEAAWAERVEPMLRFLNSDR